MSDFKATIQFRPKPSPHWEVYRSSSRIKKVTGERQRRWRRGDGVEGNPNYSSLPSLNPYYSATRNNWYLTQNILWYRVIDQCGNLYGCCVVSAQITTLSMWLNGRTFLAIWSNQRLATIFFSRLSQGSDSCFPFEWITWKYNSVLYHTCSR